MFHLTLYDAVISAIALLKHVFPAQLFPFLTTFIDDSCGFNFDMMEAALAMMVFVAFMSHLGFRFKWSKMAFPSTVNELTGIIGNSVEGSISLPQRKIDKALSRVNAALDRDYHSKLQLVQLGGSLTHCSLAIEGATTICDLRLNILHLRYRILSQTLP